MMEPAKGLAPDALRSVLDNAPVGIWVAEPSGGAIFVNAHLASLAGRAPAEMLGPLWKDLVHPDERDEVARSWDRARETATPWRMEYRLLLGSANDAWFQGEAVPVRDEAGELALWVGMLIDVTDRKAAEDRLSSSEALFRAVFENAPIGIALVALEGERTGFPVEVNPALCKILGRSREQMFVSTPAMLSHPDEIELARGDMSVARQGRMPDSPSRPRRYLRGDGATVWIRATRATISLADGTFGLTLMEDVTERKQAEDALAEAEARFNAALWDAPVGIMLVSLDGEILDVNPTSCALVGRTREELLGSSAADLTHPDDLEGLRVMRKRTMRGDVARHRSDMRLRHADGTWRWTTVTASLVLDHDGRPHQYLIHCEDNTDKHAAHAAATGATNLFDRMFWESPVATAIIDPDMPRMIDVNPAMSRFLGVSRDELLSTDVIQVAAAFSGETEGVVTAALAQRRLPKPAWERRFRRGDGSIAWGRLTSSDVVVPGTDVRRRVVQVEDITSRVQQGEALARREQLMEAAFGASPLPLAIVEVTAAGASPIVHANGHFGDCVGREARELTGRPLSELLAPAGPASSLFTDSGAPVEGTVRVLTPQGTGPTFAMRPMPLATDDDGTRHWLVQLTPADAGTGASPH